MTLLSSPVAARRRRSPLLGGAACVIVLGACAPSGPSLAEANPQRGEQVRQVCTGVMGFTPIDSRYRLCFDSLMESLASSDEAVSLQNDRLACAGENKQPGTPAFNLCVVDRDNQAPRTN